MPNAINEVRNIALIGHSGSGKTSLAESILFNAGLINKIGRTDQGNSIMDFEPEEINRKISINTSFHPFNWNNSQFNIIDTPGEIDFLSDTKICLQAAEMAAIVLDAVGGIKAGTEKVRTFAHELNLPRLFFVNMVDKERADFFKVLSDIEEMFKIKTVPLYLPIGQEKNFSGLIDLLNQKSINYSEDQTGNYTEGEIPEEMKETALKWREKILENIVELDEQLMEKYLSGASLNNEDLEKILEKGIKACSIMPVVPGSAEKNIGIKHFLDVLHKYAPYYSEKIKIKAKNATNKKEAELETNENAPFSALIFKTIIDPFTGRLNIFKVLSGKISANDMIYNANEGKSERINQILVIEGRKQRPIDTASVGSIAAAAKLKDAKTGHTLSLEKNPLICGFDNPLAPTIYFAVEAKDKDNEEKAFASLFKLAEEDPTLKIYKENSTGESIVAGMGRIHLESVKEKLLRKFGVEINLKTPKIPYKETVKNFVQNIEYKHKKQSGGRGQFAVVCFDILPLTRGEGFVFEEALSGTNVPRNFVPAVEKGVNETLVNGILAGFPITDLKIKFFDGKYHEVDSSEMAFKIAASYCFTQAFRQAEPILLEPIMKLEIIAPEELIGDIMGDLNSRRGKVLGTDILGKYQIIKAEAPLAEIQRYAYDLTSITGGRGSFTMEQVRYDEVPPHLAEKVIAEVKNEAENQ